MIDFSLAVALRESGLRWHPQPGDRFTVTASEMEDEVFHVADMVVEVRRLETGTIFAFNGTTEWALDSVTQDNTVWLPDESHLRTALGPAFRQLALSGNEYVVTVARCGEEQGFTDENVENAYGQALLSLLDPPPAGKT